MNTAEQTMPERSYFMTLNTQGKNGGQNRLVFCKYEFSYDPSKKSLVIQNYVNDYYRTQVYFANVDVQIFPF